jgi:hypothetical protein
VTASDPLREAELAENRAKVIESDAGIRRATQNPQQNRLGHTLLCAQARSMSPGSLNRPPSHG